MKRALAWFLLPIVSAILTTVLLINAQKEIVKPQEIQYATTVAKQKPQKPKAKISDGTMQQLMAARSKTDWLIKQYGIGQLIIPDVKINLPVFNTVNEWTLSSGAVQYFYDRKFLQGNTVLASHNFLDADLLMYRLKDLKRDQKIFITNYDKVYMYNVVSNKIVDKHEISVLNQTSNNELTLIRCFGGIGTNQRLVVKAKQIDVQSLKPMVAKKWNITNKKKPVVKKLSFMGTGLANSYITGKIDYRLWIVLLVNAVFIILAITMAIGPKVKNDTSV